MKFLQLIILSLFTFGGFAQLLDIGLYNRYKVYQISLSEKEGTYKLFGDSLEFDGHFSDPLTIAASGDSVFVRSDDRYYGKFLNFSLISESDVASFKIKCLNPVIKEHAFSDNVVISAVSGKLLIINKIDMHDYLAGVIQSEGGGGRSLEYYKVQALISRTYALKNWSRHAKEGFNLCDAQHCQAYHNMHTATNLIPQAVKQTENEIMVSKEGELIGTYFHANCGGQTSDASFVWNNSLSYCKPFMDTFCTNTKQANWTVKVSKWKWENFLMEQYGLDVKNEQVKEELYQFKQAYRKAFYIHPSLGIPLRDLRTKFELKSTFFDVSLAGNEVVIDGKGFGHGVGLCQEGAMEMAEQGYLYDQIAHFYFNDILIMKFDEYLFYKENFREISNEE